MPQSQAAVSFTPTSLAFPAVRPGTSGPDISVFVPDAVSSAGGVLISSAPAAAKVTAKIAGDAHLRVRDVSILKQVLVPVDSSELPPGHKGPPPKERVTEIAAQSNGLDPLLVRAGDMVLVRVAYDAPNADAALSATLEIVGDTWAKVEVPVTLFTADVRTTVGASSRFIGIGEQADVFVAQGQTAELPIVVQSLAGPAVDVSYEMSRTQLHTGLTLQPSSVHLEPKGTVAGRLVFRADANAPLGLNAVAVDQIAFGRRGFFVQVKILAAPQADLHQLAVQKITEKYNALGGRHSRLGRAVDEAAGVQFDGHSFYQDFRGGTVAFSPQSGTVAFNTQSMIVRFRGIHCFGKSEAVDEPYAIVGAYLPDSSDHTVTKKFPIGRDSYTDFVASTDASEDTDVFNDVAPQTLVISSTVMEHDSGDPDRAAAAVEDALKKAASEVGALDDISVYTGILDDLKIPGLIADVLGVGDDVIGSQHTSIAYEQLIPKPPMRQFGNIQYNLESPLLSDGDASYKLYYEAFVVEITPPRPL